MFSSCIYLCMSYLFVHVQIHLLVYCDHLQVGISRCSDLRLWYLQFEENLKLF